MGKFQKAPPDPNGGHMRMYWAVWDSPAWKVLSPQQRLAYLAIQRHLGSTNNGALHLTLPIAKHAGIKSPATLAQALRALVAVGLLAVTREGGCERDGERLPTLYAVTHLPVFEQKAHMLEARKATSAWKQVESISQARALIRKANEHAKAKHQQRKTKTALQNLNTTPSVIEAVGPKTSSKIEVRPPRTTSKNEVRESGRIARKPKNGAGSGAVVDFPVSRSRTSKNEANVLSTTPMVVSDADGSASDPATTTAELFARLQAAGGLLWMTRTPKAAQPVEAVA